MGDFILYILVGLAVYGVITTMWNDRQENKRMREEMEQRQALDSQQVLNKSVENKKGARDLFLDILTNIGCQYQLGEDDDTRIFFAYQGEHFFADTTNDIMYVHLWDTHWGHVDLCDIDEVSRLRKAINTSNLNTAVTTVFTIDEEGKNMDVHSKSTIPFISSMLNLEDYLKVELNEFFRSHQMVGTEIHKLREQEQNA
jgi:hypothetical protein